ncbi:MAG TPA: DUF1788 domain-containing protein [bacterium]|nr:DUF1788 domain-containing protein [bacterium]HOC88704.1 DUF1788 domain-containing protein [bacterium]HOZ21798.1 DUF1788 domain-containing protein [bacterium]
MGRIENLVAKYKNHIATPWQKNLAGDQKTIFVVYPPAEERRLRAKLQLFEIATVRTGHKWNSFDFTRTFAEWMARVEYKEIYFEEPDSISMKLHSDFLRYAADQLAAALTADEVDENTVVAVHGVASLYGLAKVSLVLKEVVREIRGRLVLFFPGEYENNNYRLLDARDNWNYLAVPITFQDEMDA